jgi:hypothetical protein
MSSNRPEKMFIRKWRANLQAIKSERDYLKKWNVGSLNTKRIAELDEEEKQARAQMASEWKTLTASTAEQLPVILQKVILQKPSNLQEKILAYLNAHAPGGEWVNRRKMMNSIRAWDYESEIVQSTLSKMEFDGLIDQDHGTIKSLQWLIRLASS